MEEIIIFSKKFHRSIEELIEVLFLKNYFGFESDCQNYGDRIYDFVVKNISSIPVSKNSPQELQKYGKKYLRYEDNNQIYWYIFLDQKDTRFLVKHILNNHSQEFLELI